MATDKDESVDRMTILVAIDLSRSTGALLDGVADIMRTGVDAVHLLHVMPGEDEATAPTVSHGDLAEFSRWQARLEGESDAPVQGEIVEGTPWSVICERADQRQHRLIVMGSRGRSLLTRILLGSQTENVLHNSRRSLCILRLSPGSEGGGGDWALAASPVFSRILYATDFSENARACIPFLRWMANVRPDALIITHIQDLRHLGYVPEEMMEEFNRLDSERLDRLRDEFTEAGFPSVTTALRTGNAIEEILSLIHQYDPTIVVMGAKGRHGIKEMLLGGVTETIVHHAPAHVIVAR